MKKVYSVFSYPYLQLNKFGCLLIFAAALFSVIELSAQWCVPGSAYLIGNQNSVDPPIFSIVPPNGPDCQSMVFICKPIETCPITQWGIGAFFGGSDLDDTCMLLSNSSWVSNFSANSEYCWGTHTFGGPIIYGNSGNLMRLQPALPLALQLLPLDGASGTETHPLIKWQPVINANSYLLRVYTDPCGINKVFEAISFSDSCRISSITLFYNSNYYWHIKPYGQTGEGPAADLFHFTTAQVTTPPEQPVLYEPADFSRLTTLTPKFDWDSLNNSTGYRIQFSLNQGFTSVFFDTNGISPSFFIPRINLIQKDIRYYWRVKSVNSFGESPWSVVRNFIVPKSPEWTLLSTGTSSFLFNVQFIDSNIGFANGSGGVLIKTNDGGSLWSLVNTGTTQWLSGLFFLNKDTGWISSDNYFLRKTTNGGVTWESQSAPYSQFINTIYFLNNSTGFLGCNSGHTFWTTNSGINWNGRSLTPGYSWKEFSFPADGGGLIGYIGGENTSSGAVLKTTDGGLNWQKITPEPNLSAWGIGFVNSSTGFYCGYDGKINYTSNGGISWTAQNSRTTNILFDIFQVNTQNAWTCGAGGKILYTNDAGTYWDESISNTASELRSIYFINSNTGWACGSGGTIVKTVTGYTSPSEPVAISPVNGAISQLVTPYMDWSTVNNSLSYKLQVSTDPDFSSFIINDSIITSSDYSVPQGILNYFTYYYWKVSAKLPQGWGSFSPVSGFRTFGIPQVVSLIYPENNSTEQPVTITFIWNKALQSIKLPGNNKLNINNNAVKFPDAIGNYWFELTYDTISLAGLVRDTLLTDTLKNVNNLELHTKYYWRVKAKNEIGWGQFSNWSNFTTTYGPPQAPVLNSPGNITTQFPDNILFNWFRAQDFSSKKFQQSVYRDIKDASAYNKMESNAVSAYWFELATDTILLSDLTRDTLLTDTLKILNLNRYSTKFYWRVKAKNQHGWGLFSSWFSFLSLYNSSVWSMLKDYSSPYYTSISFVSQDIGFASGSAYWNAEVHKTTNGGLNWFETADFPNINHVDFMNELQGCATVSSYPGYGVCNDGGYNWFFNDLQFFYSGGFSSCARDVTGIYVCGLVYTQNPAQGYKTIILRDGGEILRDNDAVQLNRIRLYAPGKFWCVGQNTIYHYDNGSLSKQNLQGNFTGVSFPEPMTGYIAGGDKLYKTINGGGSWQQLHPLEPEGSYSDIKFVNKDTGWIACDIYDRSGILATTDGGINWSVQWAGPKLYQPYELSIVNANLGYAAFYGEIVKMGESIVPPILASPANGATGQTLTPLLDWQDVTDAVKYRVQLATDTGFSSITTDDSTITSSEYSVPSGLLQNFTLYYWRVAAKNSESWSSFSERWSFRTFGIPNSVLLNYPPNNASGISSSLTFNWFTALPTKKTEKQTASKIGNLLSDAAGTNTVGNYWFELTRDTVNLTDLVTDSLLTDTSKSVSGLIFSNPYYWRVKAKNEAGWGAFSPWWKFTTTNGAPVLQQPVNNQTEVQVTPLLNWSDVPEAQKYRVQVSAFSNFSVLWLDDSSSSVSELQVPNGILAYNSLYYWRVKTRNSAGWGEYQTAIRFFTQVVPPPAVPVLFAPANGAAGVELTPLLNWNDVTGSTKYRVQVSLSSDFSSALIDDSTIVVSEYQVSSGILNSNTQFYWRVAAKGSSSWSSFSSAWSFTTLGLPQPVILFSPVNNAEAQQTELNFVWYKASEIPGINPPDKNTGFKTNRSKDISLNGVDAISLYHFELTTDTVTFSGIVSDSTLTDTVKFVSGLAANSPYYWRVKAKNSVGWGAFSMWWKFTTMNNTPPSAPVLISPVNNASNISVTPVLDWSDIPGCEKYRVQVSAFSNFSVIWIDDSNSVSSQFQVQNGILAYNSAYYWRVKAKNSYGWGVYQASPSRFFTLITPPPSAPLLLSPSNGSTGVMPAPQLDWNNVNGAVKYKVQLSSLPDFSSIVIEDTNLTNSEFNVPGGILNNGSKYYWRAAAKDNTAWGDFSAVWNFTTLGTPQAVVLTYPLNNAVDLPLNITFNWHKAADLLDKLTNSHNSNYNSSKIFVKYVNDGTDAINAYWFELTTDTLTFAGLVRDTVLSDTMKIVNGLSSNTAYYWRVKAGNELGWGPFSGWWKFTTSNGLPPVPPVQVYPLNNAQNVTVTPQLDWSDVSGAQKYRLQVSALSNFSVLWIDDSNLTSSVYQVNNGVLAYNSVYYWRIKAKNTAGWGNYQASPFRFFTMIIPPPAVPVLLTPQNGATGISLTPLFDWNDISGAAKYRLVVSSDTGFSNIIVDDSTLVSSQYSLPAGLLTYSTEYYWKVAAKNSIYWSTFSGKFSFKTFGSPQTVVLLSPANNSIEQPLNITFTWMKAMETLKKMEPNFRSKDIFTGNLLFGEKGSVDAISRYWFEIVTDTVSMAGIISDTTLTDTVKSLTGLTAMTNYYWRVKALNEVGWGPFSSWWKFTTISGLPPSPPVLIYPANREADISVTPVLNWSDVPGAQKYYLQVSAFSNFSVLWVNDSNIVQSEYQVPNGILAYNSGYYWRVKAGNGAGWGNFQVTPFRFFTLVTPPQAPPALISPVNGSVNVPLTPLLDWSDVASALKYRIQVSAVNTFVTTVVDDSSLSASQYNISAGILTYNTGYYWRVSVKTGTVWSAFSNSWSFTTVTALGSPSLQLPLNKDTGIAVTTIFKWSNVAGATSYRLQVSAFSNFSVLWIDKYVTDTAYQTPNGVLAYNSRYFWKVKSLRAGDSSSFSNPNYFFTKIFPYSFDMPEFESTRRLDLTGLISTGKKASYDIEFSKDTLFDNPVFKLSNIKGETAELNLEQFDEYSTYFWRICLKGEKPVFSDIRVFATYLTKQSQLMSLRGKTVIPERYSLYQNYPNPFNPVCRIRFDIPENEKSKTDFVKLVVYDLIGREIVMLVNDNLEPGTYEVNWNAADMPSGIYIYQLKTALFTDTKKMVLLK